MRKCDAIGEEWRRKRKKMRKRRRGDGGGKKKKRKKKKKKVPCKQINTRRGGKWLGRFCEGGAEKKRNDASGIYIGFVLKTSIPLVVPSNVQGITNGRVKQPRTILIRRRMVALRSRCFQLFNRNTGNEKNEVYHSYK